MAVRVHVLDADPVLAPHRAGLEEAAESAVAAIGARLPLDAVDVVVQRNPLAAIPHLGIGGFCPGGHLVQVSLDPGHVRFTEVVEWHLARTLAHEWHHCARWRGPGYGRTLGEALVTEGLADHFDLEVHPGAEPYPWSGALHEDQLREAWAMALPVLWKEPYHHGHWFFNRTAEGPPFHAGYALGFWLVGAYLAAYPDLRASSLTEVAASDVVREAFARA